MSEKTLSLNPGFDETRSYDIPVLDITSPIQRLQPLAVQSEVTMPGDLSPSADNTFSCGGTCQHGDPACSGAYCPTIPPNRDC